MKQEDMPTSIQTAQVDMAALIKLQEDYDLALAENARLKTSVAQTREECAVIAETAADVLQNSTFDGVAAAIRALSPQVERRKCERRVKQVRQYFTENGNERSGNDRRKK